MNWDIFCRVVDNYGDIGVCWRLAADLAARGRQVRLWVDDAQALRWMAPGALECNWRGITVLRWTQSSEREFLTALPRADVIVEGFGCEIPLPYLKHHFDDGVTRGARAAWINLEYLSAQPYAERSHLLPSPILHGPASGQTRHFFFPGFSLRSGGLLREPDLLERQALFDRKKWLSRFGATTNTGRLVSLFCYEPAVLPDLLDRLRDGTLPTQVLITVGRATAAVRRWMVRNGVRSADGATAAIGNLNLIFLPPLSQLDFDHLLWSCDLNFVRGEDSLVRAIWADRPFVWQIYPQGDGAHHAKLDAVMETMAAPASWRSFHAAWNGMAASLPEWDLPEWRRAASGHRARLLAQTDLTTRLLEFAEAPPASRSAPENR